jgi:hypothetical protein
MSISLSEYALMLATLILLVIMACSGTGFYLLQNRIGVIGGKIALAKLVWLGYSILMWVGLPLLILFDLRIPRYLGYAFGFLFLSMAIRAIIELWMLYASKNWSPTYGILHDLFCIVGLVFFLVLAWSAGEPQIGITSITLTIHAVVTTLLFIPEIYFAMYMRKYFHTKGGDAIYFVPDEPKHRQVLRITAGVDIFLTVYLPLFLIFWFYG